MFKQLFSIGELENIFDKNEVNYKKVGDWLMMCCPFHIEDNPSFGINIYSGKYHCFACEEKGDSGTLFRKLEIECNIDDIDRTGFELLGIYIKKIQEQIKVVNNKFKFQQIIIGNNIYYDYLTRRNINNETIKKLNIGFIKNNKIYKDRIVFPIYNDNGKKLLWYEGRSISENKKIKYYRPINSRSKECLYNLHNCNKHYCIVVEGIFGVARIVQLGYDSVCVFGSTVSDKQINKLIRFTDVYFIFDQDKAGRMGMRKLQKITDLGFNAYLVLLKNGMDVDVISKKELNKFLNRSILIS